MTPRSFIGMRPSKRAVRLYHRIASMLKTSHGNLELWDMLLVAAMLTRFVLDVYERELLRAGEIETAEGLRESFARLVAGLNDD